MNPLTYPLLKLAIELDRCSPELRRLIHMVCADYHANYNYNEQYMAKLRLLEVVTTRTKEAKQGKHADGT